MSPTSLRPEAARPAINRARLDLSTLVGREVTLYAEQQPGKPIRCRVLAAGDDTLSLDRGFKDGTTDSLVPCQSVVIRFPYKGQDLCIAGKLMKQSAGRPAVTLSDRAVPLKRRRFPRLALSRSVRFAVAPPPARHQELGQLRWLQTVTLNISAGGTLLDLVNVLQEKSYLFLSLGLDDLCFPSLVIGQVRHSYQREDNHFAVGLEFLVREQVKRQIPLSVLDRLPDVVLQYPASARCEFNLRLTAMMRKNPHILTTGVIP